MSTELVVMNLTLSSEGKEMEVDRAHFEEGFTSDREASSLLEPSGTAQERKIRGHGGER
jgi:hypothetical protein